MESEKHIVPQRVARQVKRAEDALETRKTKAREYVKLLHGIPRRKRKNRSNLFVRKVHTHVENASARDATAVFQFKPYFDVESRSGQLTAQADNAEIALQYYLENAEFEMKCLPWFKQSHIEDIGVSFLGWRKSVRKVKQRLPLDQAMAQVPKFKLPPELKDTHVFIDAMGRVLTDETGTAVVHEGSAEEAASMYEVYEVVPLDKAPREVQQAYTVVVNAPKTVYDGLDFTPVDFQDCFWDPDASSVEEMRYAGHHCGRTLADLKAEQESGVPYKNLDKLEDWARNAAQIPDLARYRRRDDLGESSYRTFDEFETVFKVTHVYDIQESKLYAFVTTGLGDHQYFDGILIRDEDYPFWHGEIPYHYLPATIVPFEIAGIGIPALIQHLQEERNELRNIAMDSKVLSLMPLTAVNTNVVTDLKPLKTREPAGILEMELDPGVAVESAIKTLTPDVQALQNIEFLIRTIDQEMEEVTGVTKVSQGIPVQRRTTYSEQSLLASESNMRFKMRIMVIDLVLKRLARQALKLLDQFMDPQVEVPITGDDGNRVFKTVDREDLSFEYDIHPSSSSVENIAMMQSQAQNMISGYAAIKGSQMEALLKPAEFLREFFRKLSIKNSKRFIKTDEEIQAEQQAAMQAQMQQQQPMQGQPQEEPQEAPADETDLIAAENEAILAGNLPPVSPRNDHMAHLQGHDQAYQTIMGEFNGDEQAASQDERFLLLLEHINQHTAYMEGANDQGGAAGESLTAPAV